MMNKLLSVYRILILNQKLIKIYLTRLHNQIIISSFKIIKGYKSITKINIHHNLLIMLSKVLILEKLNLIKFISLINMEIHLFYKI